MYLGRQRFCAGCTTRTALSAGHSSSSARDSLYRPTGWMLAAARTAGHGCPECGCEHGLCHPAHARTGSALRLIATSLTLDFLQDPYVAPKSDRSGRISLDACLSPCHTYVSTSVWRRASARPRRTRGTASGGISRRSRPRRADPPNGHPAHDGLVSVPWPQALMPVFLRCREEYMVHAKQVVRSLPIRRYPAGALAAGLSRGYFGQ